MSRHPRHTFPIVAEPPPIPQVSNRVFAFDLDGTVTGCEMLPIIAAHTGLERELTELTRKTLIGELDFEISFRRRFAMLRHVPLRLVQEIAASIPLDPFITDFIRTRRHECVIVTGNLDLWIQPILSFLGCRYFASEGFLEKGEIYLQSVLHKGAAADCLLHEGKRIVAVGESANDLPLFMKAETGIAFSGVHAPAPELACRATHIVRDGASLCSLLAGL